MYRYTFLGMENRGLLRAGDMVAIKITPAHNVRPGEALVQTRVDHPNIVKVVDIGKCVFDHGHKRDGHSCQSWSQTASSTLLAIAIERRPSKRSHET